MVLTRIWQDFRRHRAVARLRGDDGSEATLNRLAEDAAHAFDAPIAAISLIDRDTQWFKGIHGLALDSMSRCDTLCAHALDRGDLLEVCSPLTDPRFRHLPPVADAPHIRYYIGAPIPSAGGFDIGTLCIADTQTRAPASVDLRACLHALVRRATDALELRPEFTPGHPR